MLPRNGHVAEMPDGNSTLLEGSVDGGKWEPLSVLGIHRESLTDDWISFPVNLPRSYPLYRVTFRNPTFQSLGGVEFYAIQTGAAGGS
jgi:hypothetical protein